MGERGEGEGVFVVLEGIDGSGTTTQTERWAAHLRAQRRLVHVTREPSGGPIGAQIRLVLTQRIALPQDTQAEVMTLLFAADRLDHVASEIVPRLRSARRTSRLEPIRWGGPAQVLPPELPVNPSLRFLRHRSTHRLPWCRRPLLVPTFLPLRRAAEAVQPLHRRRRLNGSPSMTLDR
jgi:hypothetical protein